MIDEAATMAAFYHGADVGGNQPVVAICPECGNPRTTSKQNADRMCRSCAGKHQNEHIPTHRRITIKPFDVRAAQVII